MQQGKRRLICICRIIKTIVLAFIQYNQSFIFVIAALYHFYQFASFLLLEVFILPLVVQTLFLFQLLLLQFGCLPVWCFSSLVVCQFGCLPVWLFASLVVCQFGCLPLPCICRDVKTVSVGSSRPLDRDHCYHQCHHPHHCLHYHQSHHNTIICINIIVVISWLLWSLPFIQFTRVVSGRCSIRRIRIFWRTDQEAGWGGRRTWLRWSKAFRK